jgi:hypothetical protein
MLVKSEETVCYHVLLHWKRKIHVFRITKEAREHYFSIQERKRIKGEELGDTY